MSRQRVIEVAELVQDQAVRIVVDETPIAVVLDFAGDIHAIGDVCTHGEISLSEGFVEGDTLECWAHGSAFSLHTGIPQNLPAYEPVPVYVVEIEDGGLYLDPNVTKEISS